MKNISKLLISIIVVFIVGLVVGRNGDVISSGLSFVFLVLLLSLFFSWMFDTLYIKDYKYIYDILEKKINFNKYPNNKEKNGFRLVGIVVGFVILCTVLYNIIYDTYKDSTILEILGGCFVLFLIYKLSLRFLFKD